MTENNAPCVTNPTTGGGTEKIGMREEGSAGG